MLQDKLVFQFQGLSKMIKLIMPLILILGIVGGVYLTQHPISLFPRADEKTFMEKITLSNMAPTSLSISYFTVAPTYDFIQYGEDTSVPKVALDSRVGADGLNPRLNTHYFSLKDLKADTKYYFKINSGNTLLPEGEYLTFKTPAAISGTPGFEVFSGKVKKSENGAFVAEGIVFLSSDQGQLLSAPVKDDGEWSIAYSGIRSADLSKYLQLSGTDQIKFMAYAGNDGFGLFGEYALKTSDININVDAGRVPFYRINVGQPGKPEATESASDNIIWANIKDFFKGAF